MGFQVDAASGRYHVIGWDNAATFGPTFTKYHNIYHKILFRERFNLEPLREMLSRLHESDFRNTLGPYLTTVEVKHAYRRLQFLLEFPDKLPWTIMSGGTEDSNGFPHYVDYFE